LETADTTVVPTRRTVLAATGVLSAGVATSAAAQTTAAASRPEPHDGDGDFDFLIGDWKAHVRRLPQRLVGSTAWVEYEGVSNHRKLFGGPANLEEFKVESLSGLAPLHGQTLRLYNAASKQWSIYLLDVAKGELSLPPVIGAFQRGVGAFYDQELWNDRAIYVRYHWYDDSPLACHMNQAFSDDGGQTWEVNWICNLTRDHAPN
jgi:hypothetical protein